MGAGVLGQAALKALAPFGYDLACWSRSHQEITGVASFAGNASLTAFLARTDILVVLLPLTADTRGILNIATLSGLSKDGRRSRHLAGPSLINAGRGGLQREADILAALADGTLWSASLDVFESEPLASTSSLWVHPRVVITPHVSALSSPEAVARYFWEQVERLERGESLPNRVLQDRGY
jgi:glyoxylate/hydroxypyruvate reductase A